MTGQKTKPIVIWRFSDGRTGHDSQSNGLIRSLGLLTACENFSLEASSFKNRMISFLSGKFPPGTNLPDPDLIIGAGHKTHIPMLCAQRARGGKTIVIMKPSLPYLMFDRCIVPEHDNPPARDNIITVQGALNTITPGGNHEAMRGLVLIGGPSKHYSWNTDKLISQLLEIIGHDPAMQWTIADSPRTPPGVMEKLADQQWQSVQLLPYAECNQGDLATLYAACGTVWVSEDSVSMVFEAITSGACVGILCVPRKGPGRVGNVIDKLAAENKVNPYQNWYKSRQLNAPVNTFNESERCARFLFQQILGK